MFDVDVKRCFMDVTGTLWMATKMNERFCQVNSLSLSMELFMQDEALDVHIYHLSRKNMPRKDRPNYSGCKARHSLMKLFEVYDGYLANFVNLGDKYPPDFEFPTQEEAMAACIRFRGGGITSTKNGFWQVRCDHKPKPSPSQEVSFCLKANAFQLCEVIFSFVLLSFTESIVGLSAVHVPS
jgi:hypothetical protein